jgi:hypothetical protein
LAEAAIVAHTVNVTTIAILIHAFIMMPPDSQRDAPLAVDVSTSFERPSET